MKKGGPETFREQKLSVDYVEKLSKCFSVTVLTRCERIHHELLRENLHSIGVTSTFFYNRNKITGMLDFINPDLVILGMPNPHILVWLSRKKVPCIPIFANIFMQTSMKARIYNWFLAMLLRRIKSPCVANHSLNASLSLRILGVPDSRIVPWDRIPITANPEVKTMLQGSPPRILFVGTVTTSKGIGDCIDAVTLLKEAGNPCTLTVIGEGDLEIFKKRAKDRTIHEVVEFLGRKSNAYVREAMRSHDIVVVPSRYDYAEGLPNTLIEALASRTPVVASDHPAYCDRLSHEEDCLMFRASDPKDLKENLLRLMNDSELYRKISERSQMTLSRLHFGISWLELWDLFLNDTEGDSWVPEHCLRVVLERTACN